MRKMEQGEGESTGAPSQRFNDILTEENIFVTEGKEARIREKI